MIKLQPYPTNPDAYKSNTKTSTNFNIQLTETKIE